LRYTPYNTSDGQEEPIKGYAIPEHPYSDHTQWLKYTNSFDEEKETEEFKSKYRNYIRVINKYPGMSNIDEIDEIRIDLLWKDLCLSEMHGMMDRAEKISLKLDHIYSRSRGRKGFGSVIQVTERHELLQKNQESEEKKTSIVDRMRGKKQQEVVVYADQQQGRQ